MSRFVFTKSAAAWWPVKWNEPVDGGLVVEQSLELRFKRTPWSDVDKLFQLDNVGFLMTVATDWRDIVDDAERAVPFEIEAVIEMTNRPAFAEAIGVAYMAFLRALPETRLGNSEASPAGGPVASEAATPAAVMGDGPPPAMPA